MAMAYAGQRQWSNAEGAAAEALERAQTLHDVHADLLSRSVLLRLYAQQNQLSRALEIPVAELPRALEASVAEAACSRALVLACAGRIDDARELSATVTGTSRAVEPAVLVPAVAAVCAIRGGDADSVDLAVLYESLPFDTRAVDLLVTTYRACPELLPVLLRESDGRRFRDLVERVGDPISPPLPGTRLLSTTTVDYSCRHANVRSSNSCGVVSATVKSQGCSSLRSRQ